jgi:hypothetical protein
MGLLLPAPAIVALLPAPQKNTAKKQQAYYADCPVCNRRMLFKPAGRNHSNRLYCRACSITINTWRLEDRRWHEVAEEIRDYHNRCRRDRVSKRLQFSRRYNYGYHQPILLPAPEIVSTPRQARSYVIAEEKEPYSKSGFAYRAYEVDGFPLGLGAETREEAEKRLRQVRPVTEIVYRPFAA